MAKVYELETRNGRSFRVVINNDAQEKRLFKKIEENKAKGYEVFTRVDVIVNGIHDIKAFELLCDTLV